MEAPQRVPGGTAAITPDPAAAGVLTCLSRGTGVQVKAIFDVRALLTPPLAAERIVKQSRNCALIP